MLTRVDPSLDRPMILFQDVIQVRHGPVPAVFIQSACGFEPHDRRRVRAVTVGIDDARHGMVLPSQRFGQEALCGSRVLGREEKVEGRAGRIHRDRMETRLKANPEILGQRRELVEHPFGSIKQWMNQGAFLMRGLEKVRAEFSLTALAYNMTRVLTIVGIERLLKVFKNAKNPVFSTLYSPLCRAHEKTSPFFHELSANIIIHYTRLLFISLD